MNLDELLLKYKNTLVIAKFDTIARLVDIVDDDDPISCDRFWVFEYNNRYNYISCVSSFISLNDKLSKEEYDSLVSVWNLNNINKAI